MRRYREDGERIVRLQSGMFVRRPQAYRPERVSIGQIVGLVAFVIFMYGALIYALPILLEAAL